MTEEVVTAVAKQQRVVIKTTAITIDNEGQIWQMVDALRGCMDATESEPLSSYRGECLGENGNTTWKQRHDLV